MDTANTTATPRLGRYTIDTSKSSVTFRTKHMFNLLPVKGSFAIGSGTIEVAEPLAESSINVEIDAASFHTGSNQRDTEVRSAKFLDTARHPKITFVSDSVSATTISGTLTVCGVAKPASLAIAHSEVSAKTFTVRATTRVDRYDFGVTKMGAMAGRYLDMTLEVTCVHR